MLTSAPSWLVVLGGVVCCAALTALARTLIGRLAAGAQLASIVAPLMPALGGGFAVLAALTISTEASDLSAARRLAAAEASAAARLAWASTNPDVDSDEVRAALALHLAATLDGEWRAAPGGQDGSAEGRASLRGLQQTVRRVAAPPTPTPAGAELLGALDALAAARRERLAAAADRLPPLYAATLLCAGGALVANAAALTIAARWRLVTLVGGLGVTVSLTLALLFGLAAPFDGPLAVADAPLRTVVTDLDAGLFRR